MIAINTLPETRKALFVEWITTFLPAELSIAQPLNLQPLAGDAGFRRYFRVPCQPSLIAVDSPPEKENNPAYVAVAMAFQRQGIVTPTIVAVDFAQGFLLLEDFGTRLLHAELCSGDEAQTARRYDQADAALRTIQQVAARADVFPSYDAPRLQAEMALFADWFVAELLGLTLDGRERRLCQDLFDVLIDSALEQPQVVVHRDYHSRNLMVRADDSLGVIDFQDAVVGPMTYDLVSLYKDCYLRLPASQVAARALNYKQLQRDLVGTADDSLFLRWFDLMGLQRHIKVLGIFARLSLRDGKSAYLHDLPLVIRYTLEAAQRYPEGQAFYDWFSARILPILPQQPWYRDWTTAGDSL